MRVLTTGAIFLASLLPSLVQAQQCGYYGCPPGDYCWQGYCYPQNPPPPPNPCYTNPNSYACQNYCYYNPGDYYCNNQGPYYPSYQDPCIRNPYLAQCSYCGANPYAPGCPNAQALDAAGNFLNRVNPLGLFPGQNNQQAPPPTTDPGTAAAAFDPTSLFGASDAQAPAAGADAAPPSRVRRALGRVFGREEE